MNIIEVRISDFFLKEVVGFGVVDVNQDLIHPNLIHYIFQEVNRFDGNGILNDFYKKLVLEKINLNFVV